MKWPDTFAFQTLRVWKAHGIPVSVGFEIGAVVESIINDWGSYSSVAATAVDGVAEADRDAIAELIEGLGLSCRVEDCCDALLTTCRRRVKEFQRGQGDA